MKRLIVFTLLFLALLLFLIGCGTTTQSPLKVSLIPVEYAVNRGQIINIVAFTSPGAQCLVTITGPGGGSLENKIANSIGRAEWKWTVPSTMVDGTWMVNIKSSLNDEFAFDSAPLTIETSEIEAQRARVKKAQEAHQQDAAIQSAIDKAQREAEQQRQMDEMLDEIYQRMRNR